jgi:hypothetical protein
MSTQSYYLQRAAELEALAVQASDSAVRINYVGLAQGFRDLANLASVSQMQSDKTVRISYVKLAQGFRDLANISQMQSDKEAVRKGSATWPTWPAFQRSVAGRARLEEIHQHESEDESLDR